MKLKKLIALFLAGAMALSLAACGGTDNGSSAAGGTGETGNAAGESTDAGDLPVLKVAVMPFLNSLPIEYMVQNKLDKANGFKIETVYFSNGGAMNEALAADRWEVGNLSTAAVNSLAIYGAYCIADIGHSDDVQIVSMDFPAAYQALKTGNCDVAALNPPTSFTAESEGYVVISSLSNLDVPQYDSIIVSNKAYNGCGLLPGMRRSAGRSGHGCPDAAGLVHCQRQRDHSGSLRHRDRNTSLRHQ